MGRILTDVLPQRGNRRLDTETYPAEYYRWLSKEPLGSKAEAQRYI
jgi:hypothetical protein